MAIDLATSPGGLFRRWGKIIGGVNEAATAVGATANTRANSIAAQYASAQQGEIDNLYANRDSYQQTAASWLASLRLLSQNTLIQMAIDDGTGINPQDLTTALKKLIAQMKSSVDSINLPTVSAAVTAGGANVGNGTCIASIIDAIDGIQTDYPFAETLIATCSNDGYLGGGARSGSEPFLVIGQPAAGDDLAWNWPQGSGAQVPITAFDASLSGRIVGAGDFETWEGSGNNTPSLPWEIILGTAGTQIKRGTDPYTGSYNLQIVGDGSQLTCLRQTLVNSSLAPSTVYGFNVWAKTDGTVAAGVLRIRLVDGSNAVIGDALGTANSVSQTISALTSSYTPISAFFRTPAVMPATVKLEVALSTALTNTEVLNIDRIGIVPATLLYPGGPTTAIFGGSVAFAKQDLFSVAVANNLGVTSFCRSLDRLLQLRAKGLKIPSAVSETIPDSYIG